jgi:hypothetical protein
MGNYHVKLKYIVNWHKRKKKHTSCKVNYLYSTLIMGEMASKENKVSHAKLINIVDSKVYYFIKKICFHVISLFILFLCVNPNLSS